MMQQAMVLKVYINALENKAKLFELRLGGNPIEREGCIIVKKLCLV